jgi:hypothetical protein
VVSVALLGHAKDLLGEALGDGDGHRRVAEEVSKLGRREAPREARGQRGGGGEGRPLADRVQRPERHQGLVGTDYLHLFLRICKNEKKRKKEKK